METSPALGIRTPDRRLRVFVSSTLGELSEERAAARAAVEQLRLTPVMFELGARPHAPRALYRAYLEQSDLFVGIYWQRYGWVAPDMTISGLEDELRLSEGMPRLVYLRQPAPDMEPGLRRMIDEIESSGAASYRTFRDADELRRLLADDLAAVMSERWDLGSTASRAAVRPPPRPTTRLVGRDRDVDEVAALLADRGHRLVTLTGPGGIGKTRLALAALERTAPLWTAGSYFVDLSTVTDPAQVPATIASAIGVVEEGAEGSIEALARRLGDGTALLVLDNFEQVVAAATFVSDLLQRCPNLRVVVTSRIVLRIRGERERAIAPLDPPSAGAGVDDVATSPAVALFLERARDVRPDFALTPANAPAVAELCRRLDGLPLALELVAARLRLLDPELILDRLGERLDDIEGFADVPARQRTLAATLDWSHGLLDPDARRLFGRLSVLAGPFTVPTAEAVGGWDDLDVLTALSTLVAHSMVAPAERPDGTPGFVMLETVRTYARARLEEAGESDAAYGHLEDHLVDVLESAAPLLHGPDQARVMRTLDGEVANIASIAEWIVRTGRSPGPLLRGLSGAWVYLLVRGHARRWHEFPEIAAASPAAAAMSPDDWDVLETTRAGALFTDGRYEDVVDLLVDLIPRRFAHWGPADRGSMLYLLAVSRPYEPGGPAREEFERALAILRDSGNRVDLGYALSHHGDVLLCDGDVAGATAAHREAFEIASEVRDTNLLAEARYHLSWDGREAGDLAAARDHLAVATRHYRDLDHRDGLARCLAAWSAIAHDEGSPVVAARLLGAAAAVREALGIRPWPLVEEVERRLAEQVRHALDPVQLEEAIAEGRALTIPAGLALALGEAGMDRREPSPAATERIATPPGPIGSGASEAPDGYL